MPLPKGYYLCIPANLAAKDFSYLIPGSQAIQERADSVLLFLHYIAVRTKLGKQEDEKPVEERGFVQVPKDLRRAMLGGSYKDIIQNLVSEGIIEVLPYKPNPLDPEADYSTIHAEYYKQGKSCKQYRLTGLSANNGLIRVLVSGKPHLLDKLKKTRGGYQSGRDELREALKHNAALIRYIDTVESRAALQEYLNTNGRTETTAANELLKMNCGDTDAEFDSFGFRLHAYHTRLPKALREYLYFEGYDNKTLYEIDFRSSQPFLFANLSVELIKDLVPECSEAIPVFAKYERVSKHEKNLRKFRELCQKAKIYPFFQQMFFEDFGLHISDTESKQVFCRGFFADYAITPALDKEKDRILERALPLYKHNGKLNGNFTILSIWIVRKHFRTLFQINKELKAMNWQHLVPGMIDYKQYANNCLLAQRVESAIILKRIGKDLLKQNIVFTTIHDSFLFHKNNLREVRRTIKDNFRSLNIKPPQLKESLINNGFRLKH
jgi:hypothetical protein